MGQSICRRRSDKISKDPIKERSNIFGRFVAKRRIPIFNGFSDTIEVAMCVRSTGIILTYGSVYLLNTVINPLQSSPVCR